eukprot:7399873-Pyramimonas_sp.AAC.1
MQDELSEKQKQLEGLRESIAKRQDEIVAKQKEVEALEVEFAETAKHVTTSTEDAKQAPDLSQLFDFGSEPDEVPKELIPFLESPEW